MTPHEPSHPNRLWSMKTKTMTETQTQVSPKPEAKTPWPHQNIPIKDIEIGERLRPLDEKEVEGKVRSIAELGLLNPITVSRHPTRPTIGGDPFPRPRYLLRAGLHRLEACKRLKLKEIPAVITTLVGPRAALIEVDENLMQTTLTPGQRAVFTKKRKELYEALYPATAKGKAQGDGMKRAAAAAAPERKVCGEVADGEASAKQPSFTKNTSDITGRSERSIELDVERGEKIADDVMESAISARLDKGQTLDELKKLSHEEQRKKVKEWQSAPSKPKGKSVQTPSTATPEEKTARDERAFTSAFKPALAIFDEATAQARKNIVAKLATDLNAEIHFAGLVMKPAPVSFTNGEPATVQ